MPAGGGVRPSPHSPGTSVSRSEVNGAWPRPWGTLPFNTGSNLTPPPASASANSKDNLNFNLSTPEINLAKIRDSVFRVSFKIRSVQSQMPRNPIDHKKMIFQIKYLTFRYMINHGFKKCLQYNLKCTLCVRPEGGSGESLCVDLK